MFTLLNFLRIAAVMSGMLLASLTSSALAAAPTRESADVVGQGAFGPVVAADGATLIRSDRGLTVSVRIPTPAPGTYMYPPANAFNPAAVPGHPEAFSLWGFVFNFPEECESSPCDSADFFAGRGAPAAYSVAGHIVGGSTLQLSGRMSVGSEPFGGASTLLEPRTAEVHLAIAPHGELNPEIMPGQITTPIGSSDFWWLAFFLPE